GAKRGSFAVSLTIAAFPVCATQPATPSPILIRNAETSLPLAPSASSKASSCFSSSTISIDHASEGMSCWIFSMISSMTLRGSRIEFAVFTMSVRIARRFVVVLRARLTSRPWGPRSPARAERRCASTDSGVGSFGPHASMRKSNPARAARRSTAGAGRTRMPPTGFPGSARRAARRCAGRNRRPYSMSAPSNPPPAGAAGSSPREATTSYRSWPPGAPWSRCFREGSGKTTTRAIAPLVRDDEGSLLLVDPAVQPGGADHHHRPRPRLEGDELVEGPVGRDVDALPVHGQGGPGLRASLHLQDVSPRFERLEGERRRR